MELTSTEINDVKTRLIIQTQKQYFDFDYRAMEKKTQIPPSSCLLPLNPFIDSKGIIRANGRLQRTPPNPFAIRRKFDEVAS